MGSCLSSVLESPPPLPPLNAGPGGGGGLLPASPPVRLSLPPDAVRETVRSVYDGDTLTLNGRGGKKVRLLGIDTPEIAERQPFAKEAGEYTRNICGSGEEIWLEFSGKEEDGQEGEGDREDRYGRLLAFVWVPASRGGGGGGGGRNGGDVGGGKKSVGGGFVCVNEGLVASGLATVYAPQRGKSRRLGNLDLLIKLQREARDAGIGIWGGWEDYAAVRTPSGSAFHRRQCKHLFKSTRLVDIMASEGLNKGLNPCRTCLADK